MTEKKTPGDRSVDLHISNDNTFISLVELEPGASVEKRRVVVFAKNLKKAH